MVGRTPRFIQLQPREASAAKGLGGLGAAWPQGELQSVQPKHRQGPHTQEVPYLVSSAPLLLALLNLFLSNFIFEFVFCK